nr:site-specific DNA-methyltransferase [Bifidobacterium callitrichos]
MQWLVRLACPVDGIVLEPFAGSGTTLQACAIEGMRCEASEKDATYVKLIRARMSRPVTPGLPL